MTKKEGFDAKACKGLLRDFGVKTEEELCRKLTAEAFSIPCIQCGREFPVDKIHFRDSEPYCGGCYGN